MENAPKTYIVIDGKQVDTNHVKPHATGRRFRDHWELDSKNVVKINVEGAKTSVHALRREWRTKLDAKGFKYKGKTFQ